MRSQINYRNHTYPFTLPSSLSYYCNHNEVLIICWLHFGSGTTPSTAPRREGNWVGVVSIRNVNYENNEISYYYGYGGHNFSSFVSFQLFTKGGGLGEVRFCQLVLLNFLDAFKFPIFTKFKRQRY